VPPGRLQSIAGVAGLHPSHNPETAARRRRVLRETFALLVCCEPQARHTTWREVIARTHSASRASSTSGQPLVTYARSATVSASTRHSVA